jgi:hypothetical protein
MDNYKSNCDYDDLPVGTQVKVITHYQDCYFFYGETGRVTQNSGQYLGINVKFDKPRRFEGGYIQYGFNFQPHDLIPVGKEGFTITKNGELFTGE